MEKYILTNIIISENKESNKKADIKDAGNLQESEFILERQLEPLNQTRDKSSLLNVCS